MTVGVHARQDGMFVDHSSSLGLTHPYANVQHLVGIISPGRFLRDTADTLKSAAFFPTWAGVVRGTDSIHRVERDGVHQVGTVEQHTPGHVPGRAVRVFVRAPQGSSFS